MATSSEVDMLNNKHSTDSDDQDKPTKTSVSTAVFGLEARVTVVQEKLKRAQRLGIIGVGGIGKTTLAKAVFATIMGNYEYTCFLDEVKETMAREEKQSDLQAKVWARLYRKGDKVKGPFDWSVLRWSKVLIILDDAEYESQVMVMTRADAFSSQSRVIVTARSREFLVQQDFEIYEADKLGVDDSKRLLCAHAFKTTAAPEAYEERVAGLAQKCEGLPLALKVAGGYMYQANEATWDHQLEKLVWAQPFSWTVEDGSMSILRASYLSLAPTERELFLDIATCFHGEKLEEIQTLWKADDFMAPFSGWQYLLDRCFVSVTSQDGHLLIWIHEMVRQFGFFIASQNVIKERVFDVATVNRLVRNQEAAQVRVLKIVQHDHFHGPRYFPLDIDVVFGLKELRILWLDGVYFDHMASGVYDILCNRLQFLKIKFFPSQTSGRPSQTQKTLYRIFEIQSLRFLILDGMEAFPQSLERLHALQYLDIINCKGWTFLPEAFFEFGHALEHLTICNFPGVTELPMSITQLVALRHFRIEGCKDLKTLPESLGHLHSLADLTISGCPLLSELPLSISQLKDLRHLEIRFRRGLKALPESFGLLRGLEYLVIESSSLDRIPESFGQLVGLRHLKIQDCPLLEALPDTFGQLVGLCHLQIRSCRGLQALPESFGLLRGLEYLVIERSLLHRIPESFGQLVGLRHLEIEDCQELKALPDTFGQLVGLRHLEIQGCSSLEALPDTFGQLVGLCHLKIQGCPRLEALPDTFGQLVGLRHLEIQGCSLLEALPDTFGQLVGLRHLEIQGCSLLEALPDTFGQLVGLRHLEIQGCSLLEALPDTFGQLVGLRHLKIQHCRGLEALPDTFGQLVGLRHLEIQGCWSLEALPDAFGQLVGLRHLEIQDCWGLKVLPDTFGQLVGLRHLKIKDCEELKAPPKSFGLLQGLEYLVIKSCRHLMELPKTVGQLTSLRHQRLFSEVDYKGPKHEEEVGLVGIGEHFEVADISVKGEGIDDLEGLDKDGGSVAEARETNSFLSARDMDPCVDVHDRGKEIPFKADVIEKGKGVLEDVVEHFEVADISVKGEGIDDLEGLETDSGSVEAREIRASSILCTQDLITEVEEGGEDGYCLSFKWFVSLEENERGFLMSIFKTAGYLKIHQTSTTILFEKIQNDVQNRMTRNNASSTTTKSDSCPRNIEQDGELEKGGAILGIKKKGLNVDLDVGIADNSGLDNLSESSLYEMTEESFSQYWHALQRTTRLKSFIAALKSNSHDSFCVSSEWLSHLEDYEKQVLDTNVLEAGYAKSYQTSKTTSFEKIRDDVGHPGSGTCDDPSGTSNRNDGATFKSRNGGASESTDLPVSNKLKGKSDNEHNTSGYVGVANLMKTCQNDDSTCRPQILKVACRPISTSRMASDSSSQGNGVIGYSRREQFGDSVVRLPQKAECHNISTTIEKPFKLTRVTFSGDRGFTGVVPASLKVVATTMVNCCLTTDCKPNKVRIKFHKIHGKVLDQESNDHQCHGLVLSSLRTNVYACIKSNGNEDEGEDIILNLDDEYYCHPRRRVLDNDLVWLELSGALDNCESGSITLSLEGDIGRRCQADLARGVKKAHILHFQDHRPIIFEGDIEEEPNPKLFLEVNIRYELEISYLKPNTPNPRDAIAVRCRRTSHIKDFDCYLVITTRNFCVG